MHARPYALEVLSKESALNVCPPRLPCRLPPGTDPAGIDYTVDPARAEPFYRAIRSYLPGLPDGALLPAYSGVRPKVGRAGGGRWQPQGEAWRGLACRAGGGHRSPPHLCRRLPCTQVAGPGQEAGDFRIDGPAVHGVPGLLNLFGIESPGLTASLAIAELAVERLLQPLQPA